MTSCTVLAGIPVSKAGLNYLVPSQWYPSSFTQVAIIPSHQ